MNDSLFDEDDVIYRYTSEDAERDGALLNLAKINRIFNKSPFNYVTTNLISMGYLSKDSKDVNFNNLVDLVAQAWDIKDKKTCDFKEIDMFFSGEIELPSGEQQEIFIKQNETGKFTIMLPEDD